MFFFGHHLVVEVVKEPIGDKIICKPILRQSLVVVEDLSDALVANLHLLLQLSDRMRLPFADHLEDLVLADGVLLGDSESHVPVMIVSSHSQINHLLADGVDLLRVQVQALFPNSILQKLLNLVLNVCHG